jgi:FkbM family methyltransferase
MRFSDGRLRMSTARLALLKRLWTHIPVSSLESARALDAYEGGDVLDVGAFHGWYSVLLAPAAEAGDRFVSFEPDPAAVPVLQAMLDDLGRRFPSVDLSVVTRPVGDGHAVAASWPAGESSHPRFARVPGENAEPSLTLDHVVLTEGLKPRLVKIDVEGAELSVLLGMPNILREHRPVVMLEIHPMWQPDGVEAADVERQIRDAGYEGATFENGDISRRQVWTPNGQPSAR